MADLSKIRTGDTLRLEVQVIEVDMADQLLPIRISSNDWISSELAEAAEHIPAPKVFKRGDWVKMHISDPQLARQKGIVLGLEELPIARFGSCLEVEVSWPDGQVHWYVPSDLEPDEAPE